MFIMLISDIFLYEKMLLLTNIDLSDCASDQCITTGLPRCPSLYTQTQYP